MPSFSQSITMRDFIALSRSERHGRSFHEYGFLPDAMQPGKALVGDLSGHFVFSDGQSMSDEAFSLYDDADATKVAKFECSGITTATTRTFILPDASGTIVLLGENETITGDWSFTGELRSSGGASFGSVPVGGIMDCALDGSDMNMILGSWNIVHKATSLISSRHTFASTGLKSNDRGFGLGLPNYVLANGTTATPQFTITFNKTGFASSNVYTDTVFLMSFKDGQTMPTEIKIEGKKTDDSLWYDIIDDTNPTFTDAVNAAAGSVGPFWKHQESITFGNRLDAVRVTLTFASTPANNDPVYDEFFMLQKNAGTQTFSMIQQGGDLNMDFWTGSNFGLVVQSWTRHRDNVKAFFGHSDDASISYDGTDLTIKSDEVGSGELYLDTPGLHAPSIKSGTTQGGAGAAAGELWHDTTDNTVKMGV